MTEPRLAQLGRREALLSRMRNVARDVIGDEPVRRVHLTVAIDRFLVRMLATTWTRQYTALRKEMALEPATVREAHDVLMAFLEPVLAEEHGLRWDPATGPWRSERRRSGS